jgi:hypothetical protein
MTMAKQATAAAPAAAQDPIEPDGAKEAVGPAPAFLENQWNHCLSLAFHGTGRDMLTDWGNIPHLMMAFATDNPEAPDEALPMQVRLVGKQVLLPNEDPRRVALAVKLFRTFVDGQNRILNEDLARMEAATRPEAPRRPVDEDDMAFTPSDGPGELSDLGKAAEKARQIGRKAAPSAST